MEKKRLKILLLQNLKFSIMWIKKTLIWIKSIYLKFSIGMSKRQRYDYDSGKIWGNNTQIDGIHI